MSMATQHLQRQRFSSVGGDGGVVVGGGSSGHGSGHGSGSGVDSPPTSDSSEGGSSSENYEIVPEWNLNVAHHSNGLFINTDSDLNQEDSLNLENSGVLTELERAQVESFFSGLGTEIFVCPSLANLYESISKNDWRLIYTGIPVLLHDKGSSRSRTLPRVTFVLAERGSCFALWKDTIDNLSAYKVSGPAFHTMCLSSDHMKVIGFSFDSNQAAREMWCCIERLTSDPENIALNVPGSKRRQKQQQNKRSKQPTLPTKSQISQPCQFHHVTSVTPDDTQRYFSLKAFVTLPVKHREH